MSVHNVGNSGTKLQQDDEEDILDDDLHLLGDYTGLAWCGDGLGELRDEQIKNWCEDD